MGKRHMMVCIHCGKDDGSEIEIFTTKAPKTSGVINYYWHYNTEFQKDMPHTKHFPTARELADYEFKLRYGMSRDEYQVNRKPKQDVFWPSNGNAEVKKEELSLDQIVIELTKNLVAFINAVNLNDKRITKLEQQYHDFRLWFNQESKEIAN